MGERDTIHPGGEGVIEAREFNLAILDRLIDRELTRERIDRLVGAATSSAERELLEFVVAALDVAE